MSTPDNVHESTHPSLKVKLSLLRTAGLPPTVVRTLVSQVGSILAVEAAQTVFAHSESQASIETVKGGTIPAIAVSPQSYVLVPILRSGLSLLSPFQDLLPDPDAPVYHLGLFREKTSLSPVEYYNKLPAHEAKPYELAYVLDPVIATGGTADAVIQTLEEWGVKRIVFVSVLASAQGIAKLSSKYPSVEFYVGHIDSGLSADGYILPGIGDIGDRLHTT